MKDSLAIFSVSFTGYSVGHSDFAKIVSEVNPSFLPLVELETAFAGKFTFDEPATLDFPYVTFCIFLLC